MKYTSLSLLVFSFICITTSGIAREWKDTEGRSMQAEFVKIAQSTTGDTEVVFKKENGMHYRVPLAKLSTADQELIKKIDPEAGTKTNRPTETNQPIVKVKSARTQKTQFELTITKNLVKSTGKRTKKVSQSRQTPKDYYAIYFSAHWCSPCRKFTPKLVEFYNQASSKYDNFEIIFVSDDRNKKEMTSYMHESEMPWLALDYSKNERTKELTKYSGRGIPCLVLIDSDGKVLSDSYENGSYRGPGKVMDDLKQRLYNGDDS